ncbi:hypothetical protein AVEN_1820-1 [Araneus ventricosus]|uniref:Uncharacterized protein n=1 Tax=Araneus ventricosus TaxID=182803 RepID=A0A4Y2NX65_ARAVE|nr:hypothetical protein AVEN_1820-1 [Araneus ventricosus]
MNKGLQECIPNGSANVGCIGPAGRWLMHPMLSSFIGKIRGVIQIAVCAGSKSTRMSLPYPGQQITGFKTNEKLWDLPEGYSRHGCSTV